MPPDTAKTDLRNLTLSELTDFIKQQGEADFRGKQIFSWLCRPGIESFAQMTNLSLELRNRLTNTARISRLELTGREQSADGTVKYCFSLTDNERIETVLIPAASRNTLCVSSQVGCAMGCAFCLTGTMGLKRNLSPAEIVGQVFFVRNELARQGKEKINSIVFMGMGEPLANFDNLIKALDILTDEHGLDFPPRKITVSTCGLANKIIELGYRIKVNLAVSLHAATDNVRDRLMPVNKTYNIAALLRACQDFPLPKRRRITIEYTLIKGENDSAEEARQLVHILRGLPCKINLLPYNECPTLSYERPEPANIEIFQNTIRNAGYTVMLRESRGSDISAACGQLANKRADTRSAPTGRL